MINNEYIIINKEAVEAFIAKHPHLTKILMEAATKIKEIFPQGTKLYLDNFIFNDDGSEILRIRIKNAYINDHEMVASLFDSLDKFNEEWWLLNIKSCLNLLCFEMLLNTHPYSTYYD